MGELAKGRHCLSLLPRTRKARRRSAPEMHSIEHLRRRQVVPDRQRCRRGGETLNAVAIASPHSEIRLLLRLRIAAGQSVEERSRVWLAEANRTLPAGLRSVVERLPRREFRRALLAPVRSAPAVRDGFALSPPYL